MNSERNLITAAMRSTCLTCNSEIARGETCVWVRNSKLGSPHIECLTCEEKLNAKNLVLDEKKRESARKKTSGEPVTFTLSVQPYDIFWIVKSQEMAGTYKACPNPKCQRGVVRTKAKVKVDAGDGQMVETETDVSLSCPVCDGKGNVFDKPVSVIVTPVECQVTSVDVSLRKDKTPEVRFTFAPLEKAGTTYESHNIAAFRVEDGTFTLPTEITVGHGMNGVHYYDERIHGTTPIFTSSEAAEEAAKALYLKEEKRLRLRTEANAKYKEVVAAIKKGKPAPAPFQCHACREYKETGTKGVAGNGVIICSDCATFEPVTLDDVLSCSRCGQPIVGKGMKQRNLYTVAHVTCLKEDEVYKDSLSEWKKLKNDRKRRGEPKPRKNLPVDLTAPEAGYEFNINCLDCGEGLTTGTYCIWEKERGGYRHLNADEDTHDLHDSCDLKRIGCRGRSTKREVTCANCGKTIPANTPCRRHHTGEPRCLGACTPSKEHWVPIKAALDALCGDCDTKIARGSDCFYAEGHLGCRCTTCQEKAQ